MSSARLIQGLCGHFCRPSSDIKGILKRIEGLPEKVGHIYGEYNKRDVKKITHLDLDLPEQCYKTDMLAIISRLCYLYDINAYCRLHLEPGYIEPEKKLYLFGPSLSCTLIATVIKYLYNCRTKINKSNIGINTISAMKTAYFGPLLDILNKQTKVKMKFNPLYKRVLKSEMLDRLMFDYTPTYLSTKKHWVKSVKLKKPKFKDKHLI